MANKWRYQYLDDEKLHYITETSDEDGILSEYFFDEYQYPKVVEFCTKNDILPILYGESRISTIDVEDFFEYQYKMGNVDFDCFIRLYNNNHKRYKCNHKLTLEMIDYLPAEALGDIIKNMSNELKKYVNEQHKLEKK